MLFWSGFMFRLMCRNKFRRTSDRWYPFNFVTLADGASLIIFAEWYQKVKKGRVVSSLDSIVLTEIDTSPGFVTIRSSQDTVAFPIRVPLITFECN